MKLFKCFLLFYVFTLFGCQNIENEPVKDVCFLVAGQSNAMGVGDKDKSPQQKNMNVLEYNSKLDDLVVLNDPVGEYHLGFQKAQTGSFVPALGLTYNELTGGQVLVVQAAKGGSALTEDAEVNSWGNWSVSGKLFKQSIDKVRMMQSCINSKQKNRPVLDAIFWSQGENDGAAIANSKITRQRYKEELIGLIDRYFQEFGEVPFIIIETGKSNDSVLKDNGFKDIREVQREVAKEKENVYIGYNETEFFVERQWLADTVHYNQEALNDIGTKLAYFYWSL